MPSLTMIVPPQSDKSIDPDFLQLFKNLCMIQGKTGHFLQIPEDGPTDADIQAVEELTEIISCGKTTRKIEKATWKFEDQALELILDAHRQEKPIDFREHYNESYVELFGIKISTGPMQREINCKLDMSVDELEVAILNTASDEFLTLNFNDLVVTEIFPEWSSQNGN